MGGDDLRRRTTMTLEDAQRRWTGSTGGRVNYTIDLICFNCFSLPSSIRLDSQEIEEDAGRHLEMDEEAE